MIHRSALCRGDQERRQPKSWPGNDSRLADRCPAGRRAFVDMLGRADLDAGHDKADVEALSSGLDPSAGAAVGVPGFRLEAVSAKPRRQGFWWSARRVRMSSAVSSTTRSSTALPGRPKMKSIPFSSHHSMTSGGAVITVAANGDARRRPVLPYAADQPAQMTADLDARGRLAGAQQHGDRKPVNPMSVSVHQPGRSQATRHLRSPVSPHCPSRKAPWMLNSARSDISRRFPRSA